ncbi:c-type cytochrome [Thiohalorhabdus sp. Cl-TMA]|uniref:Cytochrome c n=1 Tax=Thiohalorhabdus methylotrophus TaxID=3242694 RepID=A0ABV4TU40_9GAMM
MKRIWITLVSLTLAAGWTGAAQAEEGHASGPKDSGKTAKEIVTKGIPSKGIAPCQSCHGETGKSPVPMYPNLAGQYESYLSHALHAYRSKKRVNPTMNQQAKSLSDREIDALAGYFSAQQDSLGTPTLED